MHDIVDTYVGYYAGMYTSGIDLCVYVHGCLMNVDGTSY